MICVLSQTAAHPTSQALSLMYMYIGTVFENFLISIALSAYNTTIDSAYIQRMSSV